MARRATCPTVARKEEGMDLKPVPFTGTLPAFVRPMLAETAPEPFDSPGHLFEIKWDGVRCIAFVEGSAVRLQSRTLRDMTSNFPEVVDELRGAVLLDGVVLDGEMVALGPDGLPRLGHLGVHKRLENGSFIAYQVFDVVYAQGQAVTGVPLLDRKELLAQLLDVGSVTSGRVRYCDHVLMYGASFFEAVAERGLEGVMAKLLDGLYHVGQRSDAWQKIKPWKEAEFLIVGYTRGKGYRAASLGAVVLGRRLEDGTLVHAGSAGTGFDDAKMAVVLPLLEALRVDTCPLKQEPKLRDEPRWCKPMVTCRVKYQEVTEDGVLRFPVYVGLE